VIYDANIGDAGGDLGVGCVIIGPARWFSTSGNLPSLAMTDPAPALTDGDHCREMAGKLRELARTTRSPGSRRKLVDLAKRYDRRGDYFDRRSPQENFRGLKPEKAP
jgi:hypothetical protein